MDNVPSRESLENALEETRAIGRTLHREESVAAPSPAPPTLAPRFASLGVRERVVGVAAALTLVVAVVVAFASPSQESRELAAAARVAGVVSSRAASYTRYVAALASLARTGENDALRRAARSALSLELRQQYNAALTGDRAACAHVDEVLGALPEIADGTTTRGLRSNLARACPR